MMTRAALQNVSNAGPRKGLQVRNDNKRGMMLATKGKENMVHRLKGVQKPVLSKKPQVLKIVAKPAAAPVLNFMPCKEQKEFEDDVNIMDVDQDPIIDSNSPENIEDIYEQDAANPQLCAEYASDIYRYLGSLEMKPELLVCDDYLVGCPTNGKMRAVLIDWLVEVQQQFKLLQETLFLTVSIIDRFLTKVGKTVHKSQLQLVGVSAMLVASKFEEVYCPEVNDFVYITDNAYTEQEIRYTELRILNTLCFDFSKPISLTFLRRYSKAGDVDLLQHTLAKYTLEQAMLDYSMVAVRPSQMAAAVLHLSLLLLEPVDPSSPLNCVWSANLRHYSGYTSSQLIPLVSRLAEMLSKAPSSKMQAVRSKYSSSKLMQVCQLPHLSGDMMSRLVNL